jgi:hypothetical protein
MMNNTSYSPAQIALRNHINTKIGQMLDLCEKAGHTLILAPVTDLDFWAQRGVTTIAEYEAFWDVVEAQESAKEARKAGYDW